MAEENQQSALPLFYRTIERVNASRHRDLGLVADGRPTFAAATNSVPLAVSEFAQAMMTYPIVFIGDKMPLPVAILGLADQQNLFVDGQGNWAKGAYIPAYVRRYPFILMRGDQEKQLVLGVDTTSDLVERSAARPLFTEDGNQSEDLEKIIRFCTEFQRQMSMTEVLGRELVENDLLVERVANLKTPDGQEYRLGPYKQIDVEKLDKLPDEKFLDWRRRGILPLLHWHIGSQNTWSHLANRLETWSAPGASA